MTELKKPEELIKNVKEYRKEKKEKIVVDLNKALLKASKEGKTHLLFGPMKLRENYNLIADDIIPVKELLKDSGYIVKEYISTTGYNRVLVEWKDKQTKGIEVDLKWKL